MMRFATVGILTAVSLLIMGVVVVPHQSSASPCVGEWITRSTTTWGFTYGPDGQNRQVWWSGTIIVQEFFNRNCDITQINLIFSGDTGATLIIAGVNVFASFTVQHPTGFTNYADVGTHAIGRITASSPSPGTYAQYTVSVTPWTSGDEYKLISTGSSSKTITGNSILFALPIGFLGQTVYPEIHAGPGLKSETKATLIPP